MFLNVNIKLSIKKIKIKSFVSDRKILKKYIPKDKHYHVTEGIIIIKKKLHLNGLLLSFHRRPSFLNKHILNFRVMVVHDITL